jgi:hypothetical protein
MAVLWGGAALRRADKRLDLCGVLPTALQPRERRHSLVVLHVLCSSVLPMEAWQQLQILPN